MKVYALYGTHREVRQVRQVRQWARCEADPDAPAPMGKISLAAGPDVDRIPTSRASPQVDRNFFWNGPKGLRLGSSPRPHSRIGCRCRFAGRRDTLHVAGCCHALLLDKPGLEDAFDQVRHASIFGSGSALQASLDGIGDPKGQGRSLHHLTQPHTKRLRADSHCV